MQVCVIILLRKLDYTESQIYNLYMASRDRAGYADIEREHAMQSNATQRSLSNA